MNHTFRTQKSRKLSLLAASIAALLTGSACDKAQTVHDDLVLGPSATYEAGPVGFYAQSIAFRGRDLGYANSGLPAQRFSDKYLVYLECKLDLGKEDSAGGCTQWKLLDVSSGAVTNLVLPGFEEFYAVPAFSWPYIAYVAVPPLAPNPAHENVYCTVFNFEQKTIEIQVKKHIADDFRSTDYGHMFFRPSITTTPAKQSFKYDFDSIDGKRSVCNVSARRPGNEFVSEE